MNHETVHASPDVLEPIFRTLAHDLNNILSLILGNISLAMGMYWHEEKPLKTLSRAEQAALRARELVQQLAIYARGWTGVKAECDVAALLREAARLALLEAQAPVAFSLPDGLFQVKTDPEQLGNVFRSLIIHCVKGMQGGGVVQIAAENVTRKKGNDLPLSPGKYVKIAIGQQSSGMLPEEPLPPPKEGGPPASEPGTFMLNTVYYLIQKVLENHGGCLTKEAQLGQRLTFHLYLPAYCRKVASKPKNGKGSTKSKGRILIMDDEEMVRANVAMILEFLGYETEFASDGSQALDLYFKAQANHRPFDAVLVDLTIRGGLSGRETADKLLHVDPKAKAIVFSGHVDDPVVLDFQSFGFKGLIKKPYTLNDFSTVLNSVLH